MNGRRANRRTIAIALGRRRHPVGELRFEVDGVRQFSMFRYAQSWLDRADAFPLSPSLPLSDQSFWHSGRGGSARSALPGAISDSTPDSWGRGLLRRVRRHSPSELDFLLRMDSDDPLLENATEAVRGVRVVIMNPPFTNRSKMGDKFPKDVQQRMRRRVDNYEGTLVVADPEMEGFVDKNSIGPLFVALADRCLDPADGVLAMIHPTIALTATSGRQERVPSAFTSIRC